MRKACLVSWFILALACVVAARCMGQAEEQTDFEATVSEATPAAYQKYLQKWPEGDHARLIRDRFPEVVLFRKAWDAEDADMFARCAREFPNGLLARRAELAAAQLPDFLAARKEDTDEAYQRFLGTHEQGDYVEWVRDRLDGRLIVEARDGKDLAALVRFRQERPSSRFAGYVQALIESLRLEEVCASPSMGAFEEYCKEFPEGKFWSECQEALEESTDAAEALKDAGRARTFLAAKPSSLWSGEVRRALFGAERLGPVAVYSKGYVEQDFVAADGLTALLDLMSRIDEAGVARAEKGKLDLGQLLPGATWLRRLGFDCRALEEEPKENDRYAAVISQYETAYEFPKSSLFEPLLMSITFAVSVDFPDRPELSREWKMIVRYSATDLEDYLQELAQLQPTVATELPAAIDQYLLQTAK